MISRFVLSLLLLLPVGLSGCALFAPGASRLLNEQTPLNAEQIQDFETAVPVRKVVRLQTSIVSALDTDKRLRGLIWEELDESGLMSPSDRRRLNQSGIRVGVAGGSLPWSLESMLRGERSSSGISDGGIGNRASSFGMNVVIPEGSPSIFELPLNGASLFVPPGQIAGIKRGGELENARCVIEMRAVEYGDGWVVIRFLPQIHHGSMTRRYSVSHGAGQMPVRQNIQPLYEQQFELKLHTNETVVIGYNEQPDWTVGRMMMQSDNLTYRTERLLALRLSALEDVAGQQELSVNYSKY